MHKDQILINQILNNEFLKNSILKRIKKIKVNVC
jgi:ribosomal protein L31E